MRCEWSARKGRSTPGVLCLLVLTTPPWAATAAGQWKGKDTQLSTCDASGKKPLTDKGPHLQVKESAEVRRRGGCTCMRVMGCISHRCLLFLLHWYPW